MAASGEITYNEGGTAKIIDNATGAVIDIAKRHQHADVVKEIELYKNDSVHYRRQMLAYIPEPTPYKLKNWMLNKDLLVSVL
jgi:hypothetical protein